MLFMQARDELGRIAGALREAITEAAPTVRSQNIAGNGWNLRLKDAQLEFSSIGAASRDSWGSRWEPPKFDVIASAAIGIRFPPDRYAYEGRSHVLWYCDAQTQGSYKWFEVAFMVTPGISRRGRQDPFALDVGEESAKAIGPGMTEFQVAWPFTPISVDALDEFIDRWASWFADASQGKLTHPTTMPERQPNGSWRRT
jgi:serine/threonine-protein kinase